MISTNTDLDMSCGILGARIVIPVMTSSDPFYLLSLTSVSAWISEYIHKKVWGEIIHQFQNLNGGIIEV